MTSKYHLLTEGKASPKLSHMDGLSLESAVLYLAPADIVSGLNLCPAASPFCKSLCLYESGRMEFDVKGTIRACRVRRTRLFRDDRDTFMAQIVADIAKLVRTARRNGKQPVCRLNGTSDIMFEHIPVTRDVYHDDGTITVGVQFPNVMVAFPEVMFYDYTKLPARISAFTQGRLPANYHLTFSLSESNDRLAVRALESGMNVAVPMHIRKHNPPASWAGYSVVDGDKHDYRFLDPQGGFIVALSPKGRAAKKDHTSGFIREIGDTLDITRQITFATA